MIDSGSRVTNKRAIAIVPEGLGTEFFSPQVLPGFELEKTCQVDNQKIAESELVLLIAPETNFLLQKIRQIRSHPKTALTPLIAASNPDNLEGVYQLIDAVLPFPANATEIQQGVRNLLPLTQKIEQFSPPPDGLKQQEERWLALLRFVSSRGIFKLTPQWNIYAPQGYTYPLVDTILGTRLGEEIPQLELLAQMGLLEGRFYDKIHLCPQCQRFQLNFREVCPSCQTSNIHLEENLHHYACSYTAPSREFQLAGSLVCPKCRQVLKYLGVDYDKPSSEQYCPTCQKSFGEALVNCLCLSCKATFPANSGHLQTVWEYQLTSLAWQAAQTGFVAQDKVKDFLQQQLGLLDYEIFKKLLEIEVSISQRCPRHLSLIKLKIENYPNQKDSTAHLYQFWGKLMGNIRHNLRVNDLVTWLGGENLLILSIGTKPEQARQAIQRIQKNIASDWPDINLQPWFVPLLPDQNWELVLEELNN